MNVNASWFGITWSASVIATIVQFGVANHQPWYHRITFFGIFDDRCFSATNWIVIVINHPIIVVPEHKRWRLRWSRNDTFGVLKIVGVRLRVTHDIWGQRKDEATTGKGKIKRRWKNYCSKYCIGRVVMTSTNTIFHRQRRMITYKLNWLQPQISQTYLGSRPSRLQELRIKWRLKLRQHC